MTFRRKLRQLNLSYSGRFAKKALSINSSVLSLCKQLRKLINQNAPDARRVGIKLLEAGVPRENFDILSMEGETIGKLSSGCFSPNLKIGIGMGYLPASKVKKEGSPVLVSIRNRHVKAITSKMPFVPQTYYRKSE